ncbi:unnamed protein product [marine sediment metagenome]|uniref:Uncharacterized protein n=1 Tax=marine sediment metagenome TaxID=412755 RepID=X1C1W0_9ZZZZ
MNSRKVTTAELRTRSLASSPQSIAHTIPDMKKGKKIVTI